MQKLSRHVGAGLLCAFILSGCATDKYYSEQGSGFLKDYPALHEVESKKGSPLYVWVDKDFRINNYDSVVCQPLVYFPPLQPTTQLGQNVLDDVLAGASKKSAQAIEKRKPCVISPGSHSLIFRGAITGIKTEKQGMRVYEVLPVAMIIALAQVASGHRTMETSVWFEGEFLDAATQKPMLKILRKADGSYINNASTPLEPETLTPAIDTLYDESFSDAVSPLTH